MKFSIKSPQAGITIEPDVQFPGLENILSATLAKFISQAAEGEKIVLSANGCKVWEFQASHQGYRIDPSTTFGLIACQQMVVDAIEAATEEV
ncbi:MAG: hypothetical protein JRI39_00385 [Deltaproteobacteria bacterium]|nr:hypothetical protein [Deltaproteobacteria bacterium]